MTNLAPKELSAEQLAEWYIAQGDWSKEYSFDWFQALPMVKTGQQIYEAHIAHLEQDRENYRLAYGYSGFTKRFGEWGSGTLQAICEALRAAEQERDRLREALRTILKRWENGDTGVEDKWDATEIYAEISNAIAALAQPKEHP